MSGNTQPHNVNKETPSTSTLPLWVFTNSHLRYHMTFYELSDSSMTDFSVDSAQDITIIFIFTLMVISLLHAPLVCV